MKINSPTQKAVLDALQQRSATEGRLSQLLQLSIPVVRAALAQLKAAGQAAETNRFWSATGTIRLPARLHVIARHNGCTPEQAAQRLVLRGLNAMRAYPVQLETGLVYVYPTAADLATTCGLPLPVVQQALQALQADDLITTAGRDNQGFVARTNSAPGLGAEVAA